MFSFRARARRPPWSNPFGGGGNAAQLFEHPKDAAVVGLHVPAEAANSALERGLKPVMKSTLPTPWACICHTGLWHKEARRGPLRVKEVSLLRRFCNVVQKLRGEPGIAACRDGGLTIASVTRAGDRLLQRRPSLQEGCGSGTLHELPQSNGINPDGRRKPMKRILVGVDGSKESRQAAAFAADLAQSTGAGLTIASVVFMPVDSLGEPELVARAAGWREEERVRVSSMVREIASSVARTGLNVETMAPVGSPAETLADLARDGAVDLLVVGHRGRGAVARLLTGSVADRLVQISPKPVLVFR